MYISTLTTVFILQLKFIYTIKKCKEIEYKNTHSQTHTSNGKNKNMLAKI